LLLLRLWLLGTLLLRLLSGLCLPLLLRLPLLLLLASLRLLRLPLRALLLRRLLLAMLFLLPVWLRVRRDNRPEKEKQGSRTGCSNELHGNHLR
jgi:hypothetical protein